MPRRSNSGSFTSADERRNTARDAEGNFVKRDSSEVVATTAVVTMGSTSDEITVTANGKTITIPAEFAHLIRAEPAPRDPMETVVFRCPRYPDGRFKMYPSNGELLPYWMHFENGSYRTRDDDEIAQLTTLGLANGVYVDPPDGKERACSICKAKGAWPFAAYAQEPMDEHVKVFHPLAVS